jgi:AraC-like DNA-binding protein
MDFSRHDPDLAQLWPLAPVETERPIAPVTALRGTSRHRAVAMVERPTGTGGSAPGGVSREVHFSPFLFVRWSSHETARQQTCRAVPSTPNRIVSLVDGQFPGDTGASSRCEIRLRTCPISVYARHSGERVSLLLPAAVAGVLGWSASSGQALSGVRAALLANHLDLLDRCLPGADEAARAELASATSSLLRISFETAAVPTAHGDGDPRGRIRRRIERIIRDEHSSARLDARRICALSGVSRSTLYRIFEDTGGVAAYVRTLRLRLVHDDLVDSDLAHVPINSIAARHGLHCAASFNRIFRRAFGKSPGEVRAGLRPKAVRATAMSGHGR